MSEIKGQLLGIVLTVVVFGIVFGIITLTMETSANSVADRMEQASEMKYTSSPKSPSKLSYRY